MNCQLDNTDEINLDGASRSARWKKLRGYLKEVLKIEDFTSNRLILLEEEAAKIKSANLKLTEVIRVLSDLANEEVQREISLTLNDTDYEIVIDKDPSQNFEQSDTLDALPAAISFPVSSDDLCDELRKLPGIGSKGASRIVEYVKKAGESKVSAFLNALYDVNNTILQSDDTQPNLLDYANHQRGE